MTNTGRSMVGGLVSRIERSTRGSRAIETIQQKAAAVLDHPAPMDVFSGRFIGHPLHPVAAQVPLGLWAAALTLDAVGPVGSRAASRSLIGLGVLGVGPAVLTGVTEWIHTAAAERRVGAVHAMCNAVATGAFAISWWQRRGNLNRGRIAAMSGMAIAGVGGWLGGHLAYNRGVGVNTSAFLPLVPQWTPVAKRSDVLTGSITSGSANGVLVALTEVQQTNRWERPTSGEIVAMEARCSHRGGPLQEGTIRGNCVECPWHGARFDLETGAVRRGPASMPQLMYCTRVVDGQVEISTDDPGGLRASAT